MTKRSAAVLAGATAIASVTFAAPAAAATDRDCPDFDTQAEAQAVLQADPSDPERLDADDDGIACESEFGGGMTLPDSDGGDASDEDAADEGDAEEGSSSSGTTTPTGGVAAGAGGAAVDSSVPLLPVSGAALGLALLASGGVIATRRRVQR